MLIHIIICSPIINQAAETVAETIRNSIILKSFKLRLIFKLTVVSSPPEYTEQIKHFHAVNEILTRGVKGVRTRMHYM